MSLIIFIAVAVSVGGSMLFALADTAMDIINTITGKYPRR